jgi:hypothetical protein
MIKMLKGYLRYVLGSLLPYQRIGKSLDGDYPSADMDFRGMKGKVCQDFPLRSFPKNLMLNYIKIKTYSHILRK